MDKNKVGRPTEYSQEIIENTEKYLRIYRKKLKELIPTIEGLALFLGRPRSRIYDWIKDEDKKEFRDIIEAVLALQGKELISGGLGKKFNPIIAKVILSKHGYSERLEHTGAEGKDLFKPTAEELNKANKAIEDIK